MTESPLPFKGPDGHEPCASHEFPKESDMTLMSSFDPSTYCAPFGKNGDPCGKRAKGSQHCCFVGFGFIAGCKHHGLGASILGIGKRGANWGREGHGTVTSFTLLVMANDVG